MIKAVLFDIDGVLLDSREANGVFYQNLLTHLGYPKPTKAEVDEVFHLTMMDAIKYLTKEKSGEKIKELWDAGRHFAYPSNLLRTPEGAEEVVRKLGEKYHLGIVTSRRREGIGNKVKPLRYFEVVVTFEDFSKPKPDPESLLIATRKLNIAPDEAVYVGDAEVDVRAAHTAGMKCVAYPEAVKDSDANAKTFREIELAIESLDRPS